MVKIRRVVLDVLKPHQPNLLEFASTLAEQHSGVCVQVVVTEMDEKTETTVITLEGEHIPYDGIVSSIRELGASVHSIDEVEVISPAAPAD